ncbi:predicted protein [Sclerotinia sclerotiorum 1980 UF-70]|uniref:Uncharacterized protein n=1 Tax=Sclerotinia sclerotiorum (strain ATCC 18683 / 1980 / Ss-1) TaxID=665079 RepID=A7EFN9_SCLS1|nr:predicted protein [Sclerotinia sclerotiorum 1980 UF-70]EDO01655.1 predicted protein [Sclerotinia sclerotiorum 1980 UF-70]
MSLLTTEAWYMVIQLDRAIIDGPLYCRVSHGKKPLYANSEPSNSYILLLFSVAVSEVSR